MELPAAVLQHPMRHPIPRSMGHLMHPVQRPTRHLMHAMQRPVKQTVMRRRTSLHALHAALQAAVPLAVAQQQLAVCVAVMRLRAGVASRSNNGAGLGATAAAAGRGAGNVSGSAAGLMWQRQRTLQLRGCAAICIWRLQRRGSRRRRHKMAEAWQPPMSDGMHEVCWAGFWQSTLWGGACVRHAGRACCNPHLVGACMRCAGRACCSPHLGGGTREACWARLLQSTLMGGHA
eukprot:6700-Chlamydomonas_euryale.AAC.1